MSQILNYISRNQIHCITDYNDDYTKNNIVYTFDNVKFRTHNSNYLNFYTPLGIYNDKVIDITNRQLSFLLHRLNHFLGDTYANELKKTYEALQITNDSNTIIVQEEVFQFCDYDNISGTSHSFDLMFYLLYHYCLNNKKCKLLVIEDDNKYYNDFLQLIKNNFNVEYFFIRPNQTYLFRRFNCIRTFQNILFNEVKQFINLKLIQPIIQKYENNHTVFYEEVLKIKFNIKNNVNINTGYEKTNQFIYFLEENKHMVDLNYVDNEELKIYLLNKANKIVLTWGSVFHINATYYLLNAENKHITIIYHPTVVCEKYFIKKMDENNLFRLNLPEIYSTFTNQYYNQFTFEGELLDNIEIIDEYIEKRNMI
jgi:hypothetical protein